MWADNMGAWTYERYAKAGLKSLVKAGALPRGTEWKSGKELGKR